MTIAMFVGAFVILVIASGVQSSIGFGANLIAMPTVALFAPELVPGSLLFGVGAMNVFMLARDRAGLEVRSIGTALIGRMIGTAVAVLVLSSITDDGLEVLIGLSVLAMVAVAAGGFSPERTTSTMLTAGTVSGITAATAGIGGPPVVLLFQKAEGSKVRGSMGGFFVVGSLITLAGLAIAGKFGWAELGWGVALLPAALLGFALSGPMLPIVDRGYIRPAILTVSTAAAIVLILRAFT